MNYHATMSKRMQGSSARVIALHALTRTPEASRAGTRLPTLWMNSWSLRPAKTSQQFQSDYYYYYYYHYHY